MTTSKDTQTYISIERRKNENEKGHEIQREAKSCVPL